MRTIRILMMVVMMAVGASSVAADRRFTLVIDAGHGGHDSGAKGSRSYEKNINLSVALAFGRYVERNCPDVRVVYTRKTDVFVPLYERAEIANRNKANLFVSVHTNALPAGKVARGFETYTLGDGRSHGKQQNLDVAKRENSVILLEKDYKQHYVGYDPNSPESNIMFEFVQDHNMQQSVEFAKLLQRSVCSLAGRPDKGVHQDNFAVLRLTSMPACLIELGFITTSDEETVLNDPASVDKIARGIYNAFAQYKNRQVTGATVPFRAQAAILPADGVAASPVQDDGVAGHTAPAAKADTTAAVPVRDSAAVALPVPSASRRDSVPARVSATAQAAGRRQRQSRRTGQAVVSAPATRAAGSGQTDGIIMFDETGGRGYSHLADKPSTAAAVTDGGGRASADSVATAGNAPVFKVQILVATHKLKDTDPNLKGLTGCGFFVESGNYKYTYGASQDYNEIYRLRKTILDKFPTCFIIAFKDGKKTDVNEAIREYKRNRNK